MIFENKILLTNKKIIYFIIIYIKINQNLKFLENKILILN